jgi:hypothetical protein
VLCNKGHDDCKRIITGDFCDMIRATESVMEYINTLPHDEQVHLLTDDVSIQELSLTSLIAIDDYYRQLEMILNSFDFIFIDQHGNDKHTLRNMIRFIEDYEKYLNDVNISQSNVKKFIENIKEINKSSNLVLNKFVNTLEKSNNFRVIL